MSSTSFTSPFGANSNPFGSGSGSGSGSGRLDRVGMQRLYEEEETDIVTSPTTARFGPMTGVGTSPGTGYRGPFGGDVGVDESLAALRSPPNPESYPTGYALGRRVSVSAESLKPVSDTYDNWSPPSHPKTQEQLERLQKAIAGNFLFNHLDDEQSTQVLGALQEKPVPAAGITVICAGPQVFDSADVVQVIRQGDSGDYFYVVEKGSFDVFVNNSGVLQPGIDGAGYKVGTIPTGGSFGELALMYNAPRAATVVSTECGTLWALDRLTFRRILMESTFTRRRMYEGFLEEVPLLSSLTPYERSKIADALESRKYPAGCTIIREGDAGDSFYLLESGVAVAYRSGNTNPAKQYKKGDFFGELALLNDTPRQASVVSVTDVRVATLGKPAFQRLLGPVEGIMRRTKYEDVKTGVEEMDPLQST